MYITDERILGNAYGTFLPCPEHRQLVRSFRRASREKKPRFFELLWARKLVRELDLRPVLVVLSSHTCLRNRQLQYKGVAGQPCTSQGSPHLGVKDKFLDNFWLPLVVSRTRHVC